jgi:putative ABC transport system permease protein
MATPLSIYNLIHGGWRTVLSIVGISIAIVLIFMQLGFLGAVVDTAVVFYDEMEFDLLACSPDYYNFVDSGRFSRNDLTTIESVEFVENVAPLHISLGKWNYEQKEVQRGMLIIGVDANESTFSNAEVKQKVVAIKQDGAMLVDRTSRPRFLGAKNKKPFDNNQIGLEIELNGVRSKIVELFKIGTGLAADGATIIGEQHFQKLIPGYSTNDVGIGLIQLKPGTDIETAKKQLQKLFPVVASSNSPHYSVDILSREDIEGRETKYWQWGTPIGFIFLAGAIVAFLVGAIIVYIVLSSDITKQIGEYATLKAMGYPNGFLSKTVLEQAFILAIISYVAAAIISLVLYQVVGNLAKLPITMTLGRLILVFGSSILMSFISAMIALRKLRQADPADLF